MSIAGAAKAENHIKSFKTHLAADRTSCTKATANQLRLFLHAGAYWLMWGLRVSMPKRSMWRVAQFDTLRLRLIKIAARVVEMKTMIRVHLPTSCPVQDILRFALGRIPRLVTWQAGLERPEYSQSSLQPQTLPAPNSGSKPEPTRRVQTRVKSKEITQKPRPRRRSRQSAAFSGLAACRTGDGVDHRE